MSLWLYLCVVVVDAEEEDEDPFFANEQKTFEIEFVTFLPLFFLRFQQIIQFYDFLYFYNTFIFKRLSALSCCVAWGQVYKLYRNATEVFKEKLQRKERNLLLHIKNLIRKSLIKPGCHILFTDAFATHCCVFSKSLYRWPSLFAVLIFAVSTIRGPGNRGKLQIVREKVQI